MPLKFRQERRARDRHPAQPVTLEPVDENTADELATVTGLYERALDVIAEYEQITVQQDGAMRRTLEDLAATTGTIRAATVEVRAATADADRLAHQLGREIARNAKLSADIDAQVDVLGSCNDRLGELEAVVDRLEGELAATRAAGAALARSVERSAPASKALRAWRRVTG